MRGLSRVWSSVGGWAITSPPTPLRVERGDKKGTDMNYSEIKQALFELLEMGGFKPIKSHVISIDGRWDMEFVRQVVAYDIKYSEFTAKAKDLLLDLLDFWTRSGGHDRIDWYVIVWFDERADKPNGVIDVSA